MPPRTPSTLVGFERTMIVLTTAGLVVGAGVPDGFGVGVGAGWIVTVALATWPEASVQRIVATTWVATGAAVKTVVPPRSEIVLGFRTPALVEHS